MSLPKNWDEMSAGDTLWHALNNPRRFSTPQSTIEAIIYCVRERGLDALEELANKERLARCDRAARDEINRRTAVMLEKAQTNEPAA